MRYIVLIAIFIFSPFSNAGAYSNWAVPTTVELVKNGVLIHGAFGDPNGCGKEGFVFVSQTDSSYDSVLSISLAALMAKKELRIYSSKCTGVGFHWPGEVINEYIGSQAFFIH